MLLGFDSPGFTSLRQFRRKILSFVKKAACPIAKESLCIRQKLLQRRASPRRDDIEPLLVLPLDAPIADSNRELQALRHGLKETALLGGGLQKDHVHTPLLQQLRKHKSREARSTAKIDERHCALGQQRE